MNEEKGFNNHFLSFIIYTILTSFFIIIYLKYNINSFFMIITLIIFICLIIKSIYNMFKSKTPKQFIEFNIEKKKDNKPTPKADLILIIGLILYIPLLFLGFYVIHVTNNEIYSGLMLIIVCLYLSILFYIVYKIGEKEKCQ